EVGARPSAVAGARALSADALADGALADGPFAGTATTSARTRQPETSHAERLTDLVAFEAAPYRVFFGGSGGRGLARILHSRGRLWAGLTGWRGCTRRCQFELAIGRGKVVGDIAIE